ncbi:hypothetical protein Droror1_Dr00023723 [Drosera rotundifolia]
MMRIMVMMSRNSKGAFDVSDGDCLESRRQVWLFSIRRRQRALEKLKTKEVMRTLTVTTNSMTTVDFDDDNGLRNNDKLGGSAGLNCGDGQQRRVEQGWAVEKKVVVAEEGRKGRWRRRFQFG